MSPKVVTSLVELAAEASYQAVICRLDFIYEKKVKQNLSSILFFFLS